MIHCRAVFFSIASIVLILLATKTYCQYPFEKYPAISYAEFNKWVTYDRSANEKKFHFTITIPNFYNNTDTLTVQLTTFTGITDSSLIRVYRNKKQIQKFLEPGFSSSEIIEPLRTADFNGDGKTDVKLLIPYFGCGTAALNVRVVYLFQNEEATFTNISFDDKMGGANRAERDFDGDKNFEIITMTLQGYNDHSYWLFNLYNFIDGELKNVNSKYDYPIMIQYLYRKNYSITDKITPLKMKDFSMPLPEEYSKQ